MPLLKQRAILEAHIDFQGESQLDGTEDRDMEQIVLRTLQHDLPREVSEIFGVSIEVKIIKERYHSLSVFFSVAIAAYGILSGYKGFYDSIVLIRQQSEELLKLALRKKGQFHVNVHSRYPTFDGLMFGYSKRFLAPVEDGTPKRDGFFYFLLGLSVLQLIIIVLLVYGAVVKTYFNGG